MGGPGTTDPTHIKWANVPLKSLVLAAYGVKAYQVAGPSWMEAQRYDLTVSVPDGATTAQVAVMWRNLLAERFGLVIHHESREL